MEGNYGPRIRQRCTVEAPALLTPCRGHWSRGQANRELAAQKQDILRRKTRTIGLSKVIPGVGLLGISQWHCRTVSIVFLEGYNCPRAML